MFGLSLPEIFIILVVALLVIGPDKLPEVARGLGKGMRQVQRLANEVRDSFRLDDPPASHVPPPPPPVPASLVAKSPDAGSDGNPPA